MALKYGIGWVAGVVIDWFYWTDCKWPKINLGNCLNVKMQPYLHFTREESVTKVLEEDLAGSLSVGSEPSLVNQEAIHEES